MNQNKAILAIGASVILFAANYFGAAWADSSQSSSGNIQIKASDAIKNNPSMMKILYNIELFKQKYAAQQQKQDLQTQQNKIIDEQRKIANNYLQADLISTNNANDMTNPTNAYAGFVSKVDNSAQGLFWDQFAYMQTKVSQGKLAMNKVLQSGGTIQDALNAYYGAASIQKATLVNVNKDLNVKYHLADSSMQNQFNQYGNLKKYSLLQ